MNETSPMSTPVYMVAPFFVLFNRFKAKVDRNVGSLWTPVASPVQLLGLKDVRRRASSLSQLGRLNQAALLSRPVLNVGKE